MLPSRDAYSEYRLGLHEFREGWRPLLASMAGAGLGLTSIPFYAHGIFVTPIAEDMGWTRSAVQFAFSFVMLVSLISAPGIGWLLDRLGSRVVAIPSVLALGTAYASLSFAGDNILSFYALWIIMSVVGAGTLPVTWTRNVCMWFDHRRGLALGITMTGTGLAAVIVPPIASWLIETEGWRTAFRVLGLGIASLSLPLLVFWLRDRPARPHPVQQSLRLTYSGDSLPILTMLRQRRFWTIGIAFFLIAAAISGLITNFVPLLIERNFGVTTAASIASAIGTSVIAGRLVTGYLLDKFWAPGIAFAFLSAPIVACLVLLSETLSAPLAIGAAGLIGFAAGAELDLMSYLVGRYFSLDHYGKYYGSIFAFFALGSGFAPAGFAALQETSGSFGIALSAAAAMILVGSSMMLTLGPYRRSERNEVDTTDERSL